MSIHVSPAEDADMDRIFEIGSLAFAQNEPVWDYSWPNHWTAKGRRAGGERMLHTKNTDPNTVFIKGVDPTTGEIMGMAKWNFYTNNTFPQATEVSGHYWDTPEDKEYFDNMIPVFLAKRTEAIERSRGNIVSLDICAIDPKFQRKGVGDALVKWGLKKADELGLEAVVESSPFGKGLYMKNGFVFQEDCRVEVHGYPDRRVGEFSWLTRPKKAT